MKRTVRLTESQLVSMIQKVVNEQSLEGKNLAFCYGKTWKDIGNKMVKDKKSFKIQNFAFKGFIENIPSQPAEFTDGKRTLTINPNGTWTLSKPVEGMTGLNQGSMDGKWKCLLMPGSGIDGYTIQLDKKIGLTESDLVRSVKKVLKEQGDTNNTAQQMIDSWNKIIKPKLKENGWSEGHGKYRMVKKHPYDKWYIHCVCIPQSGKDAWFAVYRVENQYDTPTINQSVEFKPPKCGGIQECAKRTLTTALKNAADI